MLEPRIVTALLAGTFASSSAHEVWIERHGATARVHVGDAAGERDKGCYILVARNTAPADLEIAGQKVASLQHAASLSYVAD